MQNQKEIEKINYFIDFVSPVVVSHVRMLLQSMGAKVKQQGRGIEMTLSIKSGKKKVRFYLQNLFLEIATVDRDEDSLRFDENLHDFDYFLAKMIRLARSKLNILFHLFSKEDVDAAIGNITKDAKQYERIRIWRFDPPKSSLKSHRN